MLTGCTSGLSADIVIKAQPTPPTTQAVSFTSSAITDTSMTVSWAHGDGTSVLVVARQGNAVDEDPINGVAYTANAAFGSGTQIGTGNFVVYNGSESSVNITALTSGTDYYFAVYEYTSASNCYLTPALTGNATTAITLIYCAAGSKKCDEYISNVTIGTINKTSDCSTGGYADYSTISTDIAKGSSF